MPMWGRFTSPRALADHYRELALWMSDERTHHILLEMACELEARACEDLPPADRAKTTPLPRSLN
jgi:hypothetical protein